MLPARRRIPACKPEYALQAEGETVMTSIIWSISTVMTVKARNGAERKTFITYSRALRNVLCRGLLLALHPAENTCLPAVHHRPPSPAAAIATGEHSEKGRAGDNRLQ
jgi:hypothetical protein